MLEEVGSGVTEGIDEVMEELISGLSVMLSDSTTR